MAIVVIVMVNCEAVVVLNCKGVVGGCDGDW